MKGPSGSTTVTQNNTPWNAQALQKIYGTSEHLFNDNPINYYPDQTLNLDPNLAGGYQGLLSVGQHIGPLVDQGNSAYGSAVTGGYGVRNSPAFPSLNDIGYGADPASASARNYSSAIGQVGGSAADTGLGFSGHIADAANAVPGAVSPAQTQLDNLGRAAVTQNPAIGILTAEANGGFLNSNPYIDRQYRAASDPVVRQYQTATAPQTDSGFEASGRFGSGAMMNARSQNEQNLGKSLGDLSANLYGQDYANERGLMTQAGGMLGSNYLSGINTASNAASAAGGLGLSAANARTAGITGAAGAANTGLGTAAGAYGAGGALDMATLAQRIGALRELQTGYDTGNNAALRGLALQPSVLGANATPATDIIQAGQGLTDVNQKTISDLMSRYYGNELAPWQTAQMASAFIGGPYAGSSTTTTPYFTNPVAGALGAATGLNSLLGGGSGGGMFGGGSSAGNTWSSPAYDAAGSFLGMDAGGGGASAGGIGSFISSIFPFLFA